MSVRYFQVGGHIRDSLLGIESHDIDYAVEAPSFQAIIDDINSRGGKIYLTTPEYFTIRARLNNQDCDFVWCRKEGPYSDGRHPDYCLPGTIYDDLARRDFTMNAIAVDEDGNYIDPHNGIKDIENRLIKCVGKTEDRMNEDALRMLRAMRFSITKNMTISASIANFLDDVNNVDLLDKISIERIREELNKCFSYNTYHSLLMFHRFKYIEAYLFGVNKQLWLKPTNERK